IRIGDTQLPSGPGSGGSSTAPSLAPATRAAAHAARGKLLPLAAAALGVGEAEISLSGGNFFVTKSPARAGAFAKVARRMEGEKLTVLAGRARDYDAFRDKTGGAQFAEVEVDTETGQVRVLRVTAIHDFGRTLNRLLADSQINGGVIQGISYALL